MNKLSMLIYLASVCENVGVVLTVLSLMLAILSVALVWVRMYLICEYFYQRCYRERPETACRKPKVWPSLVSVVALAAVVTVNCLIPGKNTVYAIAASQVGEDAIQSPIGLKAQQAVESWLNKQIAENAKPSEAKHPSD